MRPSMKPTYIRILTHSETLSYFGVSSSEKDAIMGRVILNLKLKENLENFYENN